MFGGDDDPTGTSRPSVDDQRIALPRDCLVPLTTKFVEPVSSAFRFDRHHGASA